MNDHYETIADGAEGALCPACNKIKALKAFKQLLTPTQAQAKGFRRDDKVFINTKLCYECNPRKTDTPLHKRTKRQLMHAVRAGNIHESVVQSELSRRQADRVAGIRRATTARQDRIKAKPWMDMVREINIEIDKAKHQRYNSERQGNSHINRFATAYEELLIATRAHLRLTAKQQDSKTPAPASTWWGDHIAPTQEDRASQRNAITALWEHIPEPQRRRTREPQLLEWRTHTQLTDNTPPEPTETC